MKRSQFSHTESKSFFFVLQKPPIIAIEKANQTILITSIVVPILIVFIILIASLLIVCSKYKVRPMILVFYMVLRILESAFSQTIEKTKGF